jgi:hypothetical protein
MSEIDTQKLLDELAQLVQLRTELLTKELSPEGAWIQQYTVLRKYLDGFVGEYKYAKWQAEKPIFRRNPKPRGQAPKPDKDPKYTKHQHIGRVWSNTGLGMDTEVQEAYRMWGDRKQLETIENALAEIQLILSKFQPK